MIFYPEKLLPEQLYGTVRYLEGLQEFLCAGGTVIIRELKQEILLTEGRKTGEIYGRIRDEGTASCRHTQCPERKRISWKRIYWNIGIN